MKKNQKSKQKSLSVPSWLKQGVKRAWIAFATVMVLLALALTVFRALTPWAAQYKSTLESRLSVMLGAPVSIQDMKTSWYWFEPVLKLDDVKIVDQGDSTFKVKELLVGIDLLRSFWHWRIQPGVLFVEDATLNFRQGNTHWQLDGVALDANANPMPSTEYGTVLGWLLAHQKIVMKRVGVTLHWDDGRVTPIKPMTVVASNRDGHYRVKGHASLVGEAPSVLSVLADLDMPAGFSSNVRGQVYLSAERINFAEWRTFFSTLDYQITEGRGEVQLWLDINRSRLMSAQSALRLRDLAWKQKDTTDIQKIDSLSANMAWEEMSEGWRWTADHVRFKANGTTWPENSMTVTYEPQKNHYRLFVKTLLLEPTRALFGNKVAALTPWFEMKPRGQLNNTQLGFDDGKLHTILSRFSHVSWDAKENIPAVKHLSGAIAWEPEEGRLLLDGEGVTLQVKDKPPLEAELLNASVLWKALSHGWRVSVDRGILQHKKDLISVRGVLDGVSESKPGNLEGNLTFALHDATFWMDYLPETGLKPKLKSWLQKDITKIEQFSGRMHVKGPLASFPFDKAPGEFSIHSALSGVDLRFNPDWPLVKNISGDLKLDKRLLTAKITEADFDGNIMNNAQLSVPDLGLDHEVLTVDGEMKAPCEHMLAYIKDSPLHTRLAKLDALNIKQPAVLKLGLKFPFFPGPDTLSVQGSIDFEDNDLFLKEVPKSFGLHDLSGQLRFDTHGVLESRLFARLFDEPMSLWVRSNHGNEPHLAIDMEGYLSMMGLKEAASWPALSLVRGRTPLKAKVTITDDPNDLDHVHVASSLKGLEVDLPSPFGKTRKEAIPLTVDTHFNLERGMRLKIDYTKRLSTDLWFAGKPAALELARGEVIFGAGKAVLRDKPGASIEGQFETFDWPPWQDVLNKLQLNDGRQSNLLPGFRSVSLGFKTAELLGQHYQNIQLHAQRLPNDVWSLVMNEDVVSADLKYKPRERALSGSVSKWMVNLPQKEGEASQKLTLKPGQLPNLNVRVGSLQVGATDAGKLMIKGVRLDDDVWRLDTGQLQSEAYELKLNGDWQDIPKPETRINAELKVNDLAKALSHWNIDPVVEARQGELQFNGEWDGAPTDFSVKGVTGKMYILFKDGRITHLSPETEKKMALGKVLSILSLQTIPRRLKLDFSDLSKPGYSFDKFDGHFVLAHGIMETEDSAIDGPVARATVKGSLNLDKQLYDLSLHVMPHIAASLPVVATIAGGPVAGVATWVASKIINQGMEKISGYTYDVSGPWHDPVVQQVHIYKKQPANTAPAT